LSPKRLERRLTESKASSARMGSVTTMGDHRRIHQYDQ
jgi:hypothetical protein